jgi:hypothetical protein
MSSCSAAAVVNVMLQNMKAWDQDLTQSHWKYQQIPANHHKNVKNMYKCVLAGCNTIKFSRFNPQWHAHANDAAFLSSRPF